MVCSVRGEWEGGYLLRPGHLQTNGDELERGISFNLLSLFLGVGVEGAWDIGRGMLQCGKTKRIIFGLAKEFNEYRFLKRIKLHSCETGFL